MFGFSGRISQADLVGAMIKLARGLRLSAIAEGVETAEQHNWLAAAGCSDVQGDLFGGAVASEEIDTLWGLAQGRPFRAPSMLEAAH